MALIAMPISHLPPAMSCPPSATCAGAGISYLPLAMLAPTHIAFGLLAASLAGLLTGTPPTPAAFACAALGALLPDIDT
ncbi:MAG: metal-dependent hydrolase, partial [Acidobacteriota bacterium]